MFRFRSILYWMCCTVFAVLAAKASDMTSSTSAEAALTLSHQMPDILPVPEPGRAVLLGVGILAIAFTYRKAWLNMKRSDAATAS